MYNHVHRYIDEVDLQSFLEVSEELQVKGLCEGKKESFYEHQQKPECPNLTSMTNFTETKESYAV